MTYKEIASMIDSMGLPFAYRFFPLDHAPQLPYIVFYYPNNDDFSADNINYVPKVNINIELYSENKDFETESSVEAVLNQYGFYFEKSEYYLQTEQMYEVLYQIQTLIKEKNGE